MINALDEKPHESDAKKSSLPISTYVSLKGSGWPREARRAAKMKIRRAISETH